MNKLLPSFLIFILSIAFCFAQIPKVISGRIERIENFKSKFVDTRNIDVWLPEGYTSLKKYPVVYMHDGQMLFDSTITWNKQEWNVDGTFSNLIAQGKINSSIVVAIPNNGSYRHSEFFPQKLLNLIEKPLKDSIVMVQLMNRPQSDNYLKFIVFELKPKIDSLFSTQKNNKNTYLMGASMGGLISLYGLCEYPQVFNGAACLSIHSPVILSRTIKNQIDNAAALEFRKYIANHSKELKKKKLYIDYGSKTLDSLYKPYHLALVNSLKKNGINTRNFASKFYEGASHNEASWRSRLSFPVLFLLKK